jgi:CO/xanthine dehydrogenase Mo-binding subunit
MCGAVLSRSTPTAGAAAIACREIKEKAAKIAAHLLEVGEDDLEWEPGKFSVKGAPAKSINRLRRLHQLPRGHGARPRGGRLLRPAQPHPPLRGSDPKQVGVVVRSQRADADELPYESRLAVEWHRGIPTAWRKVATRET